MLPASSSGYVDYSSLLNIPAFAQAFQQSSQPGTATSTPIGGQAGAPDQSMLLARQAMDISGALNRMNGSRASTPPLPVGNSGPSDAAQQAQQAIKWAGLFNKSGTQLGRQMAQLFPGGAGSVGASAGAFPQGLSLFGASTPGAQFPSGLSLFGEAAGGLNPADYAGALGSGAGEAAGAGAGLGGTIGAIGGGIGGALTIAQLINSITSGQNDSSKTGSIPSAGFGLGASALPILQALIGPAAASGLGISGLGLAYAPLLIPAIKDIIHMFGDPFNNPYGAGNMAQYRSRAAAEKIPPQLNQYLLNQNDPMKLLGLATGASPLSPNQEIMGYAGGNPWGSEPYSQMLQAMLSGTPGAAQNFLKNFEFRSGETGGVHNVNEQATDTYRRQLAHSLGMTPEQTQGLFGTGNYGDRANMDLNNRVSYDVQNYDFNNLVNNPQALESWISSINSYAAPDFGGDFGQSSPYYRDPSGGRLTPEQANYYTQYIRNKMANWQNPNPTPSGYGSGE